MAYLIRAAGFLFDTWSRSRNPFLLIQTRIVWKYRLEMWA